MPAIHTLVLERGTAPFDRQILELEAQRTTLISAFEQVAADLRSLSRQPGFGFVDDLILRYRQNLRLVDKIDPHALPSPAVLTALTNRLKLLSGAFTICRGLAQLRLGLL